MMTEALQNKLRELHEEVAILKVENNDPNLDRHIDDLYDKIAHTRSMVHQQKYSWARGAFSEVGQEIKKLFLKKGLNHLYEIIMELLEKTS